jgi:hypothetical protein
VTVGPGTATQLSVAVTPTSVEAGQPATATVIALDAYGNVATGYTGSLTLTTSDARAVVPGARAAALGAVKFDDVTFRTAGVQSVFVTDGTLRAQAAGITVLAGTTSALDVDTIPADVVAGNAVNVTVRAVDPYGNVTSDYTGSVRVTSTDPQFAAPPQYAFTGADAGTHVLAGVLRTSGMQTIVATDAVVASITGAEFIDVVAGPAATLSATTAAPAVQAGLPTAVTVTAHDSFGNIADSYSGTVHLSATDPNAVLPPDYTFVPTYAIGDGGSRTFYVTLASGGTHSVTATDTATPALTATSPEIVVAAGTVAALEVSGIATPVDANTASSVIVRAVDAFGNTVTGYAGTVHFTSSDALASLPVDYTFIPSADEGSHLFTGAVVLRTGPLASVTATDADDDTVTGTEAGIRVVLSGRLSVDTAADGVVLSPVALKPTTRRSTGSVGLIDVQDGRAGATGWSVTATLTDLRVRGFADRNHTIAAASVTLDPTANDGCHPVTIPGSTLPTGLSAGVTAGPRATLDRTVPATICTAQPGSGVGKFQARPSVEVRIDPWKAAGTYTGVLTITIS